MFLHKSQSLHSVVKLLVIAISFFVFAHILLGESHALDVPNTIPSNNESGSAGNDDKVESPAQKAERERLERENMFNAETEAFANGQARLGNELAQLPGPQISFSNLMRVIITWSASLAASVAIFLFVLRSFAAISGSEEAHNQFKSTIIKILIGLVLIFFSYQLVSFIMGIIWAGTQV